MPDLEKEFQKALKEIGPIKPWWSEEDELYVFEHPAYPVVDYAAKTPQEVIEKYKRVLRSFIEDRLAGNVAESVDRMTPGRGGHRPGARPPKRSTKRKTRRINLPDDVATWLTEDPSRIEQVRALMAN
jgi:hypothetical protein